jgi:VanZ family protein
MHRIFKILSISLIVLLFTVGSMPAVGEQFSGAAHWMAHLAAYAVIALVFGLGWNKIPAVYVALMIGVVGVIHEVTEIASHGHPFETRDAIVNFLGAVAGSAILTLYKKRLARNDACG